MRLFVALGALSALVACDDTFVYNASHGSGDGDYAEGFCGVEEVFEGACLTCHSAASALGGLDLETDPIASLVGVPSAGGGVLVTAGDRDASVLFLKSAGSPPAGEGGVMPPGSSGLGGDALEVIGAWIDAGATTDCGASGDSN